eukprot:CAMPEP_0178952052 /NCGR_PEP_ID=MMETSP0789-20121207/7578_1 /TAXON_ID=3005 /ORGANISM="Rhizosolenia setigera, Strain CCMP 1694" /LENGTH=245 /DNA_ID=CAMNT_0020633015 /DNA_START=144 /DNA_END=881 /DNA_ORIENTATION=+
MPGRTEKCFNYIIPEEDDANLFFVVVPLEELENVQDFYIDRWLSLTKKVGEKGDYPTQFGDVSADIDERIQEIEKKRLQNPVLRIQYFKSKGQLIDSTLLKYYRPYVLDYIVERAENKGYGDSPPLEGYQICVKAFQPRKIEVALIFDVLHWDDEENLSEKKKDYLTKDHLSPLERDFKKSEAAIAQILDEFDYQERRDADLYKISSNTNSKVQLFSYFSIFMVIATAYCQVFYLKTYFRKKKIL